MAKFNKIIVTNKGKNIIASLLAQEKQAKFSKICTCSDIYSENEILNLTNLSNIKQTIPITNSKIENNSTVKIDATVNNTKLTEDYNICSLGIYLEIDNQEYLYGVASVDNVNNSIFMPNKNNNIITKFDLTFITTISNVEDASLVINDSMAYVTEEEYNKKLLYTYTLTLLAANWTQNTTTNYYEYNVVNTNITADTLVNIYADLVNQEKLSSGYVESYNGGFKIIVSEEVAENVDVTITYQITTTESTGDET